MKFSYPWVGVVGAVALVVVLIVLTGGIRSAAAPPRDDLPATAAPPPTPTPSEIGLPIVDNTSSPNSVPSSPVDVSSTPRAVDATPNAPDATSTPTEAGETPTPIALLISQPNTTIYLPVVASNGGSAGAASATTPTPTPAATSAPAAPAAPSSPPPTARPVTTRGPIRVTKLGLGVYASGGGMLGVIDQVRPSVILLMDPTLDFAQEVRRRYPKAFIVGRVYVLDQPLDNPTQRGSDFADRVSALAVPLKGTVDAWVSYNEVGSPTDLNTLVNYNLFQVAFAHRLQDVYGVAAVAGNDGPRSVPAELYPRYFADAIKASRYFGFHSYPDPSVRSLRDPTATDQVFYYRKIRAALDAAGIKSGPFIATEIGLYNGWRGVVDDTSMGADFTWVADQMNNDPYVIGMTIFGVFRDGDRWPNFEIAGSNIPDTLGNYNTIP